MKIKILKINSKLVDDEKDKIIIDNEGFNVFKITNNSTFGISKLIKKILNFVLNFEKQTVKIYIDRGIDKNTIFTIGKFLLIYSKKSTISNESIDIDIEYLNMPDDVNKKLSSKYISDLNEIYHKYFNLVRTTSNIIDPYTIQSEIKGLLISLKIPREDYIIRYVKADERNFTGTFAVGKAGNIEPYAFSLELGKNIKNDSEIKETNTEKKENIIQEELKNFIPIKTESEHILLGKGVCYDSGGYSIKNSENMERMHTDKGGACLALLSAILYYATTGKNIVVVTSLVENLISSKAYRPGDIIKCGGKTIQVLNTDAEGRIILADLVSFVSRNLKYKNLFIFATLTGAAKVIGGPDCGICISDSKKITDKALKSAETCGEHIIILPDYDIYLEPMIKTKVANIRNISKGYGAGTINAHKFIQYFAENRENRTYTHFDIANYFDEDSFLVGHNALDLMEFTVDLLINSENLPTDIEK